MPKEFFEYCTPDFEIAKKKDSRAYCPAILIILFYCEFSSCDHAIHFISQRIIMLL